MLYLLAIICPPLAVLMCGKPGAAALNFLLWLLLIVPGIIHAMMVVSEYKSDQRTKAMMLAMHQPSRTE